MPRLASLAARAEGNALDLDCSAGGFKVAGAFKLNSHWAQDKLEWQIRMDDSDKEASSAWASYLIKDLSALDFVSKGRDDCCCISDIRLYIYVWACNEHIASFKLHVNTSKVLQSTFGALALPWWVQLGLWILWIEVAA